MAISHSDVRGELITSYSCFILKAGKVGVSSVDSRVGQGFCRIVAVTFRCPIDIKCI